MSSGDIERRTCNVCSKVFSRPSSLVYHYRIHNNEKPFKCRHCTRAFTQKIHLTKHVHSHHFRFASAGVAAVLSLRTSAAANEASGNVANSIPCPNCQRYFRNQLALMEHMAKEHGIDGVPLHPNRSTTVHNNKKIEPVSSGLHTRIPAHQGKEETAKSKQCLCYVCGKYFASDRSLKEHERLQHMEALKQSWTCKYCDKTFSQRMNLTRHFCSALRRTEQITFEEENEAASRGDASRGFENPTDTFKSIKIEDENEAESSHAWPALSIDAAVAGQRDINGQPTVRASNPSVRASSSTAVPLPDIAMGSTQTPSCANCELMRGELRLMKSEIGILKQFLGNKLTLMEQKLENMNNLFSF